MSRSHGLTFASSILGESPPPPPRAIFGRDELIEKIVGLAETLTPVALIGAGGIGKTSIALTILHDDRVKQRFGQSRRFIRCDQFPPSSAHFLNRLSKVIGAGVENPEDLAPLRPTLSSKEMLIVLSNAESVLDPQGTDAREIYNVVEELSRFETICLCITSRITIVPQHYKRLVIPTLSIESARDAFYRIYKNGERSDLVSNILVQLDSHPLSITLLATTAHHNKWSTDRLTREWERRRTGLLHTHHVKSLAVTIELSLASPMFQGLGPNARDLLGIVAFFPQGVDENSIDWLFPTISNKTNIFDTFCVFALTYRSYGFVTMLAPLRDYLRPEDPKSSPLLCTTKDRYLSRLSVGLDPNGPGFEEARWIVSEDVNIEYLLDVFTSVDANSDNIWDACADFMRHLSWHNKRLVVLRPKIEGLPDDHRSKPECLFELSQLFHSIGNYVESKRLLIHALMLWRAQGNDLRVAETMMSLADANRQLSLHEEATRQAQEALEIYKSLNHVSGQAFSLARLAWLLFEDTQLDAAEAAAFQAIDLLLAEGKQYEACRCYRLFGAICRSKGEIEKAFDHFETALKISSSSNQHDEQFWSLYSLAELFYDQRRFDDAQAHVERAKLHTANDAYNLGRVMGLQAHIWYTQGRLDEAKSEALRAVDVYQKLEAVKGVEDCRMLLRDIEEKTGVPVTW